MKNHHATLVDDLAVLHMLYRGGKSKVARWESRPGRQVKASKGVRCIS